MLTFGSLFAGIGGIDLGLQRAGMVCKFQVEIDEFCQQVLAKHWPDVPRFRDVRECGAHNLPTVDVLAGGFPCQDISSAGFGAGLEGSRSGLWYDYARIIGELRPRYVLVENVAALLFRGIDRVCGDLATLGYDAEWEIISACAMGAPHTRERLFLLAHAHEICWPQGLGAFIESQEYALSEGYRRQGARAWLQGAAPLPGVAYGLPDRLVRSAALGNAVVPQCAEFIGRMIMAIEAAS